VIHGPVIKRKGIVMNNSSTNAAVEVRRPAVLRRLRCAAVTAVALLGPFAVAVIETAGWRTP
jgi:hypothetical protein